MIIHTSKLYRGIPNKDSLESLEEVWGSRKCYNGFIHGILVENRGKSYILLSSKCSSDDFSGMMSMVEVDSDTVGRSTGRWDALGNLIFEGDVIKDLEDTSIFKMFEGYIVRYDEAFKNFLCLGYNEIRDFKNIKSPLIIGRCKGEDYV